MTLADNVHGAWEFLAIFGPTAVPFTQMQIDAGVMSTNPFDPNKNGVIPLPAAAWMGMSLLGGMGALRFIRRRKS